MSKLLFWFLLLSVLPIRVGAQALLAGSQYYDSFQSLAQVVILSAAGDEAGLAYLAQRGHISEKIPVSRPIIVIAKGREPDSGCEFQFPDSPALFWTFSRNVFTQEQLAAAEPTPSPGPSVPPHPTGPKAQPKKEIEWHLVSGRWKWRPLDPRAFKGWEAGAAAPHSDSHEQETP
jgi:hypothetical protein